MSVAVPMFTADSIPGVNESWHYFCDSTSRSCTKNPPASIFLKPLMLWLVALSYAPVIVSRR